LLILDCTSHDAGNDVALSQQIEEDSGEYGHDKSSQSKIPLDVKLAEEEKGRQGDRSQSWFSKDKGWQQIVVPVGDKIQDRNGHSNGCQVREDDLPEGLPARASVDVGTLLKFKGNGFNKPMVEENRHAHSKPNVHKNQSVERIHHLEFEAKQGEPPRGKILDQGNHDRLEWDQDHGNEHEKQILGSPGPSAFQRPGSHGSKNDNEYDADSNDQQGIFQGIKIIHLLGGIDVILKVKTFWPT